MKREEKQILITNKENNGESREQAYKEIHMLELSQIQFKNLKVQLVSLMKENQRLKEQIEKLKAKNFKESFKQLTKEIKEPENTGEIGNGLLNRVIHHLEDKWYTQTDMSKELCASPKKIRGVIKILLELNKLEANGNGRSIRYKLIK